MEALHNGHPRQCFLMMSCLAISSLFFTSSCANPRDDNEIPADVPMAPPQISQAPLEAQSVAGSVAYLRSKYHISENEAMRRLELQRTGQRMHEWLLTANAETYAGMWLDQENGGVLKILSTQPEQMATTMQTLPEHASIQVTKARWSFQQLEETAQRLEKNINTNRDPKIRSAELAVDVPSNVVGVFLRANAEEAFRGAGATDNLRVAHDRILQPDIAISRLADQEDGRAVVRQLVVGAQKSSPVGSGCDPRYCDPPMRGGMRLNVLRNQAKPLGENLNEWWGECTNGFNMYDTSRGWNYIMTAGHCATGGPLAGITYSYSGLYHQVSYEVFNFENGGPGTYSTYPYDYSIQPYSDYDYWSGPYPKNRVVSYCWWSPSTWQGCVDGTFEITGYYSYASIGIGWVVCGTGSGDDSPDSGYRRGYSWHPGTYCGEVQHKDGGIVTNICTREGDSGGPLFSEIDGRAYGILSGGTPGSGPCPFDPPGSESSWYSPIDKILAQVKSQTMYLEGKDYGFQLRTWP